VAEYRFIDEQNQLRDAVRKFSADHFAEDKARQLMESDPPFDPKVWARLGGELGVLGLSVPEADGGVGGTLVDQAVAIEELGARLACGPLSARSTSRSPHWSLLRPALRVTSCWATSSRDGAPRRSRWWTGPVFSTRKRSR
jgi:alkylation response protein AidB-like acyl-CoA dehydrogenase